MLSYLPLSSSEILISIDDLQIHTLSEDASSIVLRTYIMRSLREAYDASSLSEALYLALTFPALQNLHCLQPLSTRLLLNPNYPDLHSVSRFNSLFSHFETPPAAPLWDPLSGDDDYSAPLEAPDINHSNNDSRTADSQGIID